MTIPSTNERVILWPLDEERDNLKSIYSITFCVFQ